MKTGVVQDGVLSPAVSNYYLAEFTTPPPNIKLIKYADDITIYCNNHSDSTNNDNFYPCYSNAIVEMCLCNDACKHTKFNQFCYISFKCVCIVMLVTKPK